MADHHSSTHAGVAHNGHAHHHGPSVLTVQPQEMAREAIDKTAAGSGFWTAVVVFGLLFLVGLVALFLRVSQGLANSPSWGYSSAVLGWLFSTVTAAPLVALGLRFNKSDWRRPISRVAELFAACGLVVLLLFAVLIQTLPPIQGRLTIWFDWWVGAPTVYDTLAVAFTVILGLAALYFSAVPDFAAMRDRSVGAERDKYARWALGWQGAAKQWKVLHFGLIFIGAFYVLMVTFVHLLYISDFGMSLMPGWRSAIVPAQSMLIAFQCAIASTIIAAFFWRQVGGLDKYILLDQFWALAKLLLATSLLWFYFFWSDFITFWYGRTPREISVLQMLITGPYLWAFILAFVFAFFIPWWTLIWNKIRVSIVGPTIIAVSVLTGNFFQQIRWYVSPRSVSDQLFAEGHVVHYVERIPPAVLPDVLDIGIIVGMIGGVVLFYLLAAKVVPPLSIWEMKQGLLLRTKRRYLKGEFVVVGKPT